MISGEEWRGLPPNAVIRIMGVTYYLAAWDCGPPSGTCRFRTVHQDQPHNLYLHPEHPLLEKARYLGVTLGEYLEMPRHKRPY